MPRDVTTCRNSTYDMLNFALEYWNVISILTADRQNELQAYELNDSEQIIVTQLSDVLKVSHKFILQITLSSTLCCTGSQGCNSVLLVWHT